MLQIGEPNAVMSPNIFFTLKILQNFLKQATEWAEEYMSQQVSKQNISGGLNKTMVEMWRIGQVLDNTNARWGTKKHLIYFLFKTNLVLLIFLFWSS